MILAVTSADAPKQPKYIQGCWLLSVNNSRIEKKKISKPITRVFIFIMHRDRVLADFSYGCQVLGSFICTTPSGASAFAPNVPVCLTHSLTADTAGTISINDVPLCIWYTPPLPSQWDCQLDVQGKQGPLNSDSDDINVFCHVRWQHPHSLRWRSMQFNFSQVGNYLHYIEIIDFYVGVSSAMDTFGPVDF